MNLKFCLLLLCIACSFSIGTGRPTRGDSALELLSGFDTARIKSVYPPRSDDSIGELAKLIYRIRGVDRQNLAKRISQDSAVALGDAVDFSGEVESIRRLEVPTDLIPFLEFSKLYVLRISAAETKTDVVAHSIDPNLQVGDRVAGVGVAIEVTDQGTLPPLAIAVANPQWFPRRVPNLGWQLLRDEGLDISLISALASRDRKPLTAADGDAFYGMLAAATSIGKRDQVTMPMAKPIEPLEMLQKPDQLAGQWIEVALETVQITRVSVSEPDRQSQLASDHYYQIDAVGDLDNVIVAIEPNRDDGQPVFFEGRYPVSVVVAKLPEFLRKQILAKSGNNAVLTDLRTKINVTGFYYRLWSYQSEFMNQQGGGDQFGPLLLAAKITDLEPQHDDTRGVAVFGTIAAVAVIAGVLTIFLWHRKTSAADAALRNHRQAKESKRLNFPSSST